MMASFMAQGVPVSTLLTLAREEHRVYLPTQVFPVVGILFLMRLAIFFGQPLLTIHYGVLHEMV